MRTRLTAQLGICVLVSTAAWGTDVAPVAVTPGSAAEGVVTVEVCPFFEWTPVDAAVSYELVVYRVAEDGVEARPVLQEWIRGAYQSLSTPANRCLERGVSYAWAVRARGSDEVSDWSEPVFFQVGSVPRTVDDLEEPEAATELSTEPQGQPRKGTVPPKRPRVETRPDEPAGQESVLRLAFALTETTLEALAQSTGSRLASDLTSHFVRNGAGLDNLTAMLADTFDDKQLSELAVFFESSPGRAWSDGGPSLEVIEMLSIAGDPPDSGRDPDGGGWARRLAELVSVDFAVKDESRRQVFLASLTGYLAEVFSPGHLESLTSFFETGLGRSWRENERTLTQALLVDTGVLGCALAVLAPNLEKALAGRPQPSEEDLAAVLENSRSFNAAVLESCACVWHEAEERWGGESLLSFQYQAQLPSLMQELWQSGECPTAWAGSTFMRSDGAAEFDREIDLRDNPTIGDPEAKYVLIEFCDYHCSYCATHHREVYPEITREYVETGRLRVAKVPLLVGSLHPQARKTAAVAYCAGEQGRFWEMDAQLLEDQERLREEPWTDHASDIGLDLARFQNCLNSGSHGESLEYWGERAQELQLWGTPSFVLAEVGMGEPGKVRVLDTWTGVETFPAVKKRIDAVLRAGR